MRLSWGECKNRDYQPQPSYNGKQCGHKIFKAIQIAWFFYTKFQHHDQNQNQYHWNLLNKFWLLITFGVLSKVSLKVKVKLFKVKNIVLPPIFRNGNINSNVTYVHYSKNIYIFNSFFTSDNNLHTVQASDARWKKSENWLLSLFLHILKCKVSWQT